MQKGIGVLFALALGMEVCCECIVLFQTSEYAVEELI
jgi:hypothetical protein